MKVMQGLGTELFSMRDTLVEQLTPDNRVVTPDHVKHAAAGRPLNYLQIAILNRQGETVVANNMLQPLKHSAFPDLADILRDMAKNGGTLIHDDENDRENGLRLHVILPLTLSREVIGQEAFFLYLYIAPDSFFSDILANQHLASNERLHIYADDSTLLFSSSSINRSSLVDPPVRQQLRSLRAVYDRSLIEPKGSAQFVDFAFDEHTLADHQVFWQHRNFVRRKWVVLYDQSISQHAMGKDASSISGVWEGHPLNKVKTKLEPPPTIFVLHQEGAYWRMKADGSNLLFSAEGRYLNRKLASTKIIEPTAKANNRTFNISGLHDPDSREIQLTFFQNSGAGVSRKRFKLVPYERPGPYKEANDSLDAFSAEDASETIIALMQQASRDLGLLSKFVSEQGHERGPLVEQFITVLQNYPTTMDGFYVNGTDLSHHQIKGENIDPNNHADQWAEMMEQLATTNEPEIRSLGRQNNDQQFAIYAPVYDAQHKIDGLVALSFSASGLFDLVHSVIPHDNAPELVVMDEAGTVIYRSNQFPFEQEMATQIRRNADKNLSMQSYDIHLGDMVKYDINWTVCEIKGARWILFNILPETRHTEKNSSIAGRWRGQFNQRSFDEEKDDALEETTPGGQIDFVITHKNSELKVLVAYDEEIRRFSASLSTDTLSAWASDVAHEEVDLEYFVGRHEPEAEQISGTLYVHRGSMVTERNFIIRKMKE